MKVLITGSSGELGTGLIGRLLQNSDLAGLWCTDIARPPKLQERVEFIDGDISNTKHLDTFKGLGIDVIYHLAGVLSSGGERDPLRAHNINVNGSLNVLEFARKEGEQRGRSLQVIFPSTMAVYGFSPDQKKSDHAVLEHEGLDPITMYGANKLYVEKLGIYYSEHFGKLVGDSSNKIKVDFRAIRYPGILSSETLPTGGTSDYGPEMLHSAATSKAYSCFVPADARLPFTTMPEAVDALLQLRAASQSSLSCRVYNIQSFSISAAEIESLVKSNFPNASIDYQVDERRAAIVDSWPALVNDGAAKNDWGWCPKHTAETAFSNYLVPGVIDHYRKGS